MNLPVVSCISQDLRAGQVYAYGPNRSNAKVPYQRSVMGFDGSTPPPRNGSFCSWLATILLTN
jgi:hypothetical protein